MSRSEVLGHFRVVGLQLVQQLRVNGIRQPVFAGRGDRSHVKIVIRRLEAARLLFRKQFAIAVDRRIEARHVHLLRFGRQLLKCQCSERAHLWHDAEYKCQDSRPDPRLAYK